MADLVKKRKVDLSQLFADDAKKQETDKLPSEENLSTLSKYVERYYQLNEKISNLSDEIARYSDEFNQLKTGIIPDFFDQLNLSKLSLSNGITITIERKFLPSITEENAQACFKWLIDNGHESIIKHDIKTTIKKGEERQLKKLLEVLKKLQVSFKDKEYVHPQTLIAFVKEQMSNSETKFPAELFKVFPLRIAKIL